MRGKDGQRIGQPRQQSADGEFKRVADILIVFEKAVMTFFVGKMHMDVQSAARLVYMRFGTEIRFHVKARGAFGDDLFEYHRIVCGFYRIIADGKGCLMLFKPAFINDTGKDNALLPGVFPYFGVKRTDIRGGRTVQVKLDLGSAVNIQPKVGSNTRYLRRNQRRGVVSR